MTINFNDLPVNLEFNFSNRSSNLGMRVMELINNERMFALYAEDKDFRIYDPQNMYAIDSNNEVMKYGSVDQFKADLSLALMVYDYVMDCGPVEKVKDSDLKEQGLELNLLIYGKQ